MKYPIKNLPITYQSYPIMKSLESNEYGLMLDFVLGRASSRVELSLGELNRKKNRGQIGWLILNKKQDLIAKIIIFSRFRYRGFGNQIIKLLTELKEKQKLPIPEVYFFEIEVKPWWNRLGRAGKNTRKNILLEPVNKNSHNLII